ncbi:MAG: hypothetical protein WBC44_01340 [Planctomycetaceae bacterium]
MARGRSGPVVSLFAFQDIITSVSGILIVVVLLMALELIEQPEADASSPSADARSMTEALTAAEAERESLKSLLDDETDAVEAAAGTSAGELARQIADSEAEIQRLDVQIHNLQSDAEALDAAAAALEVKQFDAADVLAEIEQLGRRADALRSEVESTRKDDRIVYAFPRGVNKSGWLVVLNADDIAVAPIGVVARPTWFRGESTAAEEFLDWSKARPADYFLLLIRPAGIDDFDAVEEDFRDRSVEYGFDVLGERATVLHPERGAAP